MNSTNYEVPRCGAFSTPLGLNIRFRILFLTWKIVHSSKSVHSFTINNILIKIIGKRKMEEKIFMSIKETPASGRVKQIKDVLHTTEEIKWRWQDKSCYVIIAGRMHKRYETNGPDQDNQAILRRYGWTAWTNKLEINGLEQQEIDDWKKYITW